jgi:hypothetical protein
LEYAPGSHPASWNPIPATSLHLSDLVAVGWFAAIGFSLTALACALGYADGIGQALAISG